MDEQVSRRVFLRRSLAGGVALLGLPLIGGCGGQSQPSAAQPSGGAAGPPTTPSATAGQTAAGPAKPTGAPIRIGLGVPFTGTLSAYGPEMQSCVELALRDVNRQVLGRPIELIVEDTEAKPDTALRKLEKLVTNDGCKFVIGFASSAEALAVAGKLPQLNAVFVATVAQTTKLTGSSCNRYTFRTALSDAQYANLINQYFDNTPGLKTAKWAILAADYEFGRDAATTFKQQTAAQIVSEEYPALGNKDFATFINKLQSVKPDFVFLPLVGQDLVNFAQQASSFGLLKQTKFLLATNIPEFTLKPLGEAAIGLQCIANYTWTVEAPEHAKFIEAYKSIAPGLQPGMYGANSYVALRMIVESIAKAGEPDPEKVIPVLEQLELKVPWTSVRMRKGDHQVSTDAYVTEVVKDSRSPYGVALKILFSAPGDKITPPVEQTGCKGL
ncbi:MAG: ABC transporter substrate-binding protein [Chloroflexi bacterium]|nr:ABC transporter substrate-binding protein [Chloroflexota bacterium]